MVAIQWTHPIRTSTKLHDRGVRADQHAADMIVYTA